MVGTNGIGKSTALKVLAGKQKPNLGRFNDPPGEENITVIERYMTTKWKRDREYIESKGKSEDTKSWGETGAYQNAIISDGKSNNNDLLNEIHSGTQISNQKVE